MATAAQFIPSADSQKLIRDYIIACMESYNRSFSIRDKLESADRTYMRELDFSIDRWKAEQVKRRGDITKFQNIILPVAMPQVESAVTFQSEMFLSGFPIFGVVSDPENADAAVAMDTIIGDQQITGGWILEFQKAFRDGFKYDLLGMKVDWAKERTFSVTPIQDTANTQLTELLWEGNEIKHLDLYNTFFDSSVQPGQLAKDGEFAGTIELFSGLRLRKWFKNTVGIFNEKEARESGRHFSYTGANTATSYYFPSLNPEALISPESIATTNWNAWWQGTESREGAIREVYRSKYQIVTCYARICPADFKIFRVPGANVPQLWKFVLVNNQVLVLAERLTNAHDMLPIVLAQPYDDGLGYQTKSLLNNVKPFQEITTALANSSIHARRRAISDRMFFDPSRVDAREVNNESPNARIPVRPGAFGGDIRQAVYPVPFDDSQFAINSAEINSYLGFADSTTGMNQARQGQFTKGNRTRAEFASIMAFGSGRDKSVSQALECSLMLPIKTILKANILQYQGGVKLFNPERQELVTVDPAKLRKAMLVFKLSDGLLPSERIIDSDSLTVAMQTIQAVPQLAQAYNLAPMFSYIMKSRGAKLRPFEKPSEQLAYEQAMAQWQQTMLQAAQMVSQTVANLKDVAPEVIKSTLENMAVRLPQPPKPEDYGWDPKMATQGDDARSVFAQVQVQ